MKLKELFDSHDKKKLLSHIRNLIAIASADGKLDDCEIDLITKIASESEITTQELNRIFENPQGISFYKPETVEEQTEQLYDLVFIMMIDGRIHEKEKRLFMLFSEKLGLGYGSGLFPFDIIERINNAIIDGYSIDNQIMRLLEYLDEEI